MAEIYGLFNGGQAQTTYKSWELILQVPVINGVKRGPISTDPSE